MKRSDAFPGNFLGKDDLAEGQLIVTIDTVTIEQVQGDHGPENKPVMRFTEPADAKPLILNNTNWDTLATLFSEDSDDWHGQQVALYVDPSVMFGGRRVGGIRIRPAKVDDGKRPDHPKPVNGNGAVKPAAAKPAPNRPTTIEEKHKRIVAAYNGASTVDLVQQWAKYATQFQFAPHHDEEQADAYHAALERLGAAVPAGASDDIPF